MFNNMLEAGASDSRTLNNYAISLLNPMIDSGVVYPKKLDIVKKFIVKAFNFDVPKRNKLIEGALAPAFKNFILIRSIESDLFLQKGELFTSFLLGWISIEMSLIRMWLQYLRDKKFSNEKRQSLAKWDISIITEALFMVGILDQQIKDDIDCLRGFRNDVVHGILVHPEKGQIERCMKLGSDLYLKNN